MMVEQVEGVVLGLLQQLAAGEAPTLRFARLHQLLLQIVLCGQSITSTSFEATEGPVNDFLPKWILFPQNSVDFLWRHPAGIVDLGVVEFLWNRSDSGFSEKEF